MATIGTRLLLWRKGEEVGSDQFGNRYFRLKDDPKRRMVLFKGAPEASKVPAEWHGWLHHSTDEIPGNVARKPWQQEHHPNLTGTPYAYKPPGDLLAGGKRAAATGDYQAWSPN